MLKSLYIRNYILIDEIEINFSSGFTVITGETGAGKSIILGAISLLAGQRADFSVLLNQESKCIVEGIFNTKNINLNDFFTINDLDHEANTIVRREISANGKSRAFINDTPVTLNILKDFRDSMLNIHSQHETLLISGNAFQLNTIDSFASNNNILNEYKTEFKKYEIILQEIKLLKSENEQINQDYDYYSFLNEEFNAANISTEEFTEIEQEQKWLANSEKINASLSTAIYELNESDQDIISRLKRIETELSLCADFHKEIEELSQRLSQSLIEISDISDSLQRLQSQSDFSSIKLEGINTRVDEYQRLMHKHKVATIEELILVQSQISLRLNKSSGLSKKIEEKEEEKEHILKKLTDSSSKLHNSRVSASKEFSIKLLTILSQLGMPEASFDIQFNETESFRAEGKDHITFQFNANKGARLQALSQVASGGEMSRVMLGIKSLIAARNILPTIIFDEIDSGVSGKMAAKMGNILLNMSKKHQIITITHLPQIAARGNEHIHVIKESSGDHSQTKMIKLESNNRVEAIARMLGDEEITSKAIDMAKELLNE